MNYNLYLDIDGVLADFIESMKVRFDIDYPFTDKKKLYEYLDKNYRNVFIELRGLPGFNRFLDFYVKNKGSVKFLSATPSHWTNEMYESGKKQKIKWLKQRGKIDEDDVIVIPNRKEKHNYATSNSILVDDFNTLTDMWTKAGGIGIHYPSPGLNSSECYKLAEKTISTLKEQYNFKD